MIEVRVNGEPKQVVPGSTAGALLSELGFVPEAVAVAINGEVVPRRELADRALRGGEAIEVIRAVGGG